mgnify:CR=1 FL=1
MKNPPENKMQNENKTNAILTEIDSIRNSIDVLEDYVMNAHNDDTIDREFVERLAKIKAREATR